MNRITDTRERLTAAVSDLPGETIVTLAPSDYGRPGEVMFVVQKLVGDNTPANQELVDAMFDSVPAACESLENALFVSKCSGHRLYATQAGGPVQLGCEWTVKILVP